MASTEIFRYDDKDTGDHLAVRDRGDYLSVGMGGGSFLFIDPADVIRLHHALGAVIRQKGWSA
jgi:hypothetical protein